MNCAIIGIDEDDNMSALRWCADAREELGMKIWFPIVPDTDNKIAKLYGMVASEHGQLLLNRAMYIIDDRQILRAIVYYDVNSPDMLDHLIEFIHLLQTTNAKGIVVHKFWQPEWLLMDETIQSSPSPDKDKKGDMWYF
jgi:peroxiredoxin (alkyl hydroperoxide reductase subunit C)